MTGYESKRAAARDKLDDDDALTIAYQSGYYDGKKAAQPAQEPVALQWLAEMIMSDCGRSTNNELLLGRVMARIDQYERANIPPQRPWVGLTEEDFSAINQSCFTKLQAATSAESILKEKNT